jgi:hypothetical protein
MQEIEIAKRYSDILIAIGRKGDPTSKGANAWSRSGGW